MASVYKKRGTWWFRFRDATGVWRDRSAKAATKTAARLEALAAQQLAHRQRDGLAPSSENMRRTFGELMDLWRERYGRRLRSQTIIPMVEKHLRPALGKLPLGGAAAALGPLLTSKQEELSPSSLNHLRAYGRRLYAVASLPSIGWWARPNPVNRDELPKFKEPNRKRATLAAEDVPALLAALSPEWRPMFATALFLGLRRGELIALRKEDLDLAAGTLTVARSGDGGRTRAGRTVTLPIPAARDPFLEAAVRTSRSEWLFPKPDGSRRNLDLDVTAVLRRALGRAGIVEGYEHRCRKARCGYVTRAADTAQRRCPKDGHALWLRPLPQSLSFHSLRHTCATLLAKARVHPKVAQQILRHADVETTLAIYTHVDLGDMREALSRTFAANLLPTGSIPKGEALDQSRFTEKDRGLQMVGATGFEPATTCTPSKCATRLRYAPARSRRSGLLQRGEGGGSITRPGGRQRVPLEVLSAFFSTCEGRNVSTRRALISISVPVCGLRPTRDFFSRTMKLPKPDSLIFSARSSVSLMVSNTISTISALSFLENPASLHTLSTTSALVMMAITVAEGPRVEQDGQATPFARHRAGLRLHVGAGTTSPGGPRQYTAHLEPDGGGGTPPICRSASECASRTSQSSSARRIPEGTSKACATRGWICPSAPHAPPSNAISAEAAGCSQERSAGTNRAFTAIACSTSSTAPLRS